MKKIILTSISWIFGVLVFAIGLLNLFFGNDQGFGIFLILLSFIYFSPLDAIIKKRFNFRFFWIIKIIFAVFILWGALGVGELFEKLKLFMDNL